MKRQLTLWALGFTKTVKHRGKTVKVEMPLEAPGATIDIGCDLCEKRFKSQQGLGVHKLVHMKRESKEVHQLRAPTEYEIVRDVVSSLVTMRVLNGNGKVRKKKDAHSFNDFSYKRAYDAQYIFHCQGGGVIRPPYASRVKTFEI